MKIVYCSQFRDSSGYSVAARGYLKALDSYLQKNPEAFQLKILTISVEHSSKLSESELELINKYEFHSAAEISSFVENKDYVFVWHQPALMGTWCESERWSTDPHWLAFRTLLKNAHKNINLTVWEADDLPETWVSVYDRYKTSAIIVPSQWNLEVFSKRIGERNCYYIPHVLEHEIDNVKEISLPVNLDDKFVVFSMSQWLNRKGFDKLIQSFCMEFHDHDDVVLLLKTYGILMSTFNVSQEEQNKSIANEIVQLKNSVYHSGEKRSNANIVFVHGMLPYENISWMYRNSDLFALLTRGEGFGLTIAESICHEVPVLVPDKGGHVDFIDSKSSFLVDGHWSPYIGRPEYTCDMNWYEPHILSARKKLREAYNMWKEDKNSLKNKGLQAKRHLESLDFNPYSIGEQFYKSILKETKGSQEDKSYEIKDQSEVKKTTKKIKQHFKNFTHLNTKEKLDFLKDKYKDETCYILSCGPSINENKIEEYREKLDGKLVFAVKQAYDLVPDLVDFHFFNCSNVPPMNKLGEHYTYKTLPEPIAVGASNYPIGTRWHPNQKLDIFFKIPVRTEIDGKFLTETKDFDKYLIENQVERPCGPGIMFETILYTAVHLGVKEIVVVGWDIADDETNKDDVSYTEDHKHFYGSTKDLLNRGDMIPHKLQKERETSKDLYYWLKEKGIHLKLASKQSSLDECIPRVRL